MEKFEVGKVYACDLMNLCINEYYEDYNDIFDDINIEIAYEEFFKEKNYYTLLKCIDNSEKTVFVEYFTKSKVATYPAWPKDYSINNENLFDVKKEILNRPLLYIHKLEVTEISDEVLKKISCSMESGVAEELNKGIIKSKANLYKAYDCSLKALIRQNQRIAEVENMVRDFENKPKTLKKEYTC